MNNLPFKASFSEAATQLAVLCNRIDNTEEDIDALLQQEFSDALSNVAASIDRRKAFYREVNSKIEMAKEWRDEVIKHVKRYEKIKDRLMEVTKHIVASNPDIRFKDSFGKQLKVIDNPEPRLVIIDEAEIPFEYFQESSELLLDKERLKIDLERGLTPPGARLERGTQLRGMK